MIRLPFNDVNKRYNRCGWMRPTNVLNKSDEQRRREDEEEYNIGVQKWIDMSLIIEVTEE